MNCPKCGASISGQPTPAGEGQANVIDSRCTANNLIRRRRRCLKCGARVTTYEGIAQSQGEAQGEDVRSALREVMEFVKGMLEEGDAPEAEGTDQPQRLPGSGQVDNAVSVGSSQ